MDFGYKTEGTCSQYIYFSLENGIIHNVRFIGGCNGNLKAVSILTEGMSAEEAISKLGGIRCGIKNTSCGDQFARALREALDQESNESKAA